MRARDVLRLSVRSLLSAPLDAVMVIAAVAFGMALFATSLSLIQYYVLDMEAAADDVLFRQIYVAPEAGQEMKFPVSLIPRIKAECPAVRYAYAEEGSGYGDESVFLSVTSVSSDYFAAQGLTVAQGTLFADADYAPGRRIAVLGADLARRVFPAGSAVGDYYFLSAWSWEVIGVLAPRTQRFWRKGSTGSVDNQLFTPIDLDADAYSLILVVEHSSLLAAATQQAQAFVDMTFGEGRVRLVNHQGSLDRERRMGIPLFGAIGFLCGAVLLVIGVNVVSLFLGRVSRKGRAAGLAMAVGATRRDLFIQHLVESCLAGLTGGLLGIAGAFGLTASVQNVVNPDGVALPGLRLVLQPRTVVLSLLVVVGLTLALSLIPALRAVRIRAADAMRRE